MYLCNMKKTSEKQFIEMTKFIIGQKQPITEVYCLPESELPGNVLSIYTDTVKYKHNIKLIVKQIEKIAHNLNVEISIQIPKNPGGTPVAKIEPSKRFISIAIYNRVAIDAAQKI